MNQKLLSVAKGETPADLVIRNGKVVNVYSGEIYDGGVAICGDTIAAVGDVEYCIGEGTRVVDAEGKYLTPGFLDGHIHPESSSLAIRPFAEAVLAHGTTGIMTDLHEVGVVSGLEGIEAILKEAEATDLKIYFVVPSHVPFSPNLETSGGRFNPEIIRRISCEGTTVGSRRQPLWIRLVSHISSTMCDGKWLMRDRKILTLDEEAILKEACDRAKAIYKRAGIELPDRFPVVKI